MSIRSLGFREAGRPQDRRVVFIARGRFIGPAKSGAPDRGRSRSMADPWSADRWGVRISQKQRSNPEAAVVCCCGVDFYPVRPGWRQQSPRQPWSWGWLAIYLKRKQKQHALTQASSSELVVDQMRPAGVRDRGMRLPAEGPPLCRGRCLVSVSIAQQPAGDSSMKPTRDLSRS